MNHLKDVQSNWNNYAKKSPLWAIIGPSRKSNKEWVKEDFFATGIDEINTILSELQALRIDLRKGRALDFGCGVGRLTQALATHFSEVDGIDIAPEMIQLARKYNRYGNVCKYYLNESETIDLFGDNTFDFIYCNLVLQHMKPEFSKQYINEFFRILAPKGVVIFQIPSNMLNIYCKVFYKMLFPIQKFLYNKVNIPVMEMHAIYHNDVIKLFENNKAKIIYVKKLPPGRCFEYYRYCAAKVNNLSVI
ncbi:MAG: class I SAM-dependent methyltransferase [Methanotrichaceae archaeon]|jgi:2-polyprenyl-3-methyl-5-hydroxy-6-metoxy-1,4-benzoquinol methylase